MFNIETKLNKFFFIRIITVTILFGIGAFLYFASGAKNQAVISLLVLALAYLNTLFYILFIKYLNEDSFWFKFFLLGFDLLIATGAVALTGGKTSPYVFVYALVIFEAAMMFSRSICYKVSAIAGVLFLAIVVVQTMFEFPQVENYPHIIWTGRGFILTYFNLAGFLLIATLSGYLSERVRTAGKELSEQSRNLRSLRNLHENILQSITSGVITLDNSNSVIAVNNSAVSILNVLSSDELIGKHTSLIFPGITLDDFEASNRVEIRYTTPDGRELILVFSPSALKDTEGTKIGQIIVFDDLTDIKEMEAKLRESEKLALVGQLAAGLVHEIRNPLTAISGALEIIGEEIEESNVSQRLFELANKEVEKLNYIAGDFLILTRSGEEDEKIVELNNIISETSDSVLTNSNPQRIDLKLDLCEEKLNIKAGSNRLKQVFRNLLQNSLQAMPEGGTIEVNTQVEGDWMVIKVSDNGVGIEESILPFVFDPFYTTKEVGTGLGLAIIKKVIDNLNGSIRIESTEGVGTSIILSLPYDEEINNH